MASQQPTSRQNETSQTPFPQSITDAPLIVEENLIDLDSDSSDTERGLEDNSEGSAPPPYEESQLSSNMPRRSPPPLHSRRLSVSSENYRRKRRDEYFGDRIEESNQVVSKPYVQLRIFSCHWLKNEIQRNIATGVQGCHPSYGGFWSREV